MLKKIQVTFINKFGRQIFAVFAIVGLRRVNARVVFVSRDDKVLLVGCNFHSELILPGGAVNEYSEQPIDAAVRECREELRISYRGTVVDYDKNSLSHLGCYMLGKQRLQHRHIFLCVLPYDADELDIHIMDRVELLSANWYKLDELEKTTTSTELHYMLRHELPLHRINGRQFVRNWFDIARPD